MSDISAPPRVWHTHACRRVRDGAWVYANFGAERRLRMVHPNTPVVPVTLVEDPAGSHWGWIADGEDQPGIIQPTEHQFEAQFPYGWRAEQERGHGRMVRLRVEETEG